MGIFSWEMSKLTKTPIMESQCTIYYFRRLWYYVTLCECRIMTRDTLACINMFCSLYCVPLVTGGTLLPTYHCPPRSNKSIVIPLPPSPPFLSSIPTSTEDGSNPPDHKRYHKMADLLTWYSLHDGVFTPSVGH